MEITIRRQNNSDLLVQNQIRWTLFTQKNIILFFGYAIVGVLLLIVTILTLKEGGNFWGPGSAMGFSLIFLSFFYFSHTYQNKKKYIERTKQYINRYNKQSKEIEIIITNTSILYKDFEVNSEMKWTFFTQYKLYKDYLFIIADSGFLSSVIINKNEIEPDKFSELINFVSNRLQEKK